MSRLIQPLFEGPIDIVGDVHGEFAALVAPPAMAVVTGTPLKAAR